MNLTYIFGNGFDIKLGLKTSYKNFISYYCSTASKDNVIVKFKKDISRDIELWSDFEKELGEYTNEVNTAEDLLNIVEDVDDNLQKYISKESMLIPLAKENILNTFIDELLNPQGFLLPADRHKLEFKYNNGSIPEWKINVISFNYTDTIKKLFGMSQEMKRITNLKFLSRPADIVALYNIHHEAKDGDYILMGVDNVEQIANKKFREDPDVVDLMVKPVTNKSLKTEVDVSCERVIERTDLFVIYGASIGLTDSTWWKMINRRLLDPNASLVLFEYDPDFKDGRRLASKERSTKEKFLSHAESLDSVQIEKIKDRIIVAVNRNIFDKTAKLVTNTIVR
jgi:hypothetical protein